MKIPKIAIIGLSGESVFMTTDHFHQPGETICATSLETEPGGKGYNQAVAVTRLGGKCRFLSAIGSDQYGNVCEEFLKKEGVDALWIRKPDFRTAFACILTDRSGASQVTVYRGAADKLLVADYLQFEASVRTSDILLLQLEVPFEVLKEAIMTAKKHHVYTIINPAPAAIEVFDLIKEADLITPNESEARMLFRATHDEPIENVLKRMIDAGFKKAVITLGSDGALAFDGKEVQRIPPFPVTALDTTGAGDVFNAALAVEIGSGSDFFHACRFASVAAALSVEKPHVMTAIPYREDVKKRYR